jgi:hypothetical protein
MSAVGYPQPVLHPSLLSRITFEQVPQDGTKDSSKDVLIISGQAGDQEREIESKLRQQLAWHTWWLQQYWYEKGLPVEQFQLVTDRETQLEVYNWGESLSQRHLDELARVVETCAIVKDGALLRAVDYILTDNLDYPNPQTGQPTNGQFQMMERGIVMFPSGTSFRPYRLPKVSNFTGTLIHEFGHAIDRGFRSRWMQKFGWKLRDQPVRLPHGALSEDYCVEADRCVNDYARFNVDDDICESVVAALTDPACLDNERLEFLRSQALNTEYHVKVVSVQRIPAVQLPPIPNNVPYQLLRSPCTVVN